MIIEPAVTADLPALTVLEQCFPQRERWSQQLWADELLAGDRLVLLARAARSHEAVGAATFQLVAGTVDLHRVVVAAEYRRRGTARLMLQEGLRWAVEGGASRMVLEVREDNDPAVGFYRAHGFRDVGMRRDYYAPGANALVLELPLAGLGPDAFALRGTEAAQ